MGTFKYNIYIINKMNWNYIAGWFDGEGCITKHKNSQRYYLFFCNTDIKVLEKIKEFIKVDNPIKYKKYSSKNLKYYELQISKLDSIERITNRLRKLCITKKEQLEIAYQYTKKHKTRLNKFNKKRWTKIEIELLNSEKDIYVIAEKLGRTPKSVLHKKNRIKQGVN